MAWKLVTFRRHTDPSRLCHYDQCLCPEGRSPPKGCTLTSTPISLVLSALIMFFSSSGVSHSMYCV